MKKLFFILICTLFFFFSCKQGETETKVELSPENKLIVSKILDKLGIAETEKDSFFKIEER